MCCSEREGVFVVATVVVVVVVVVAVVVVMNAYLPCHPYSNHRSPYPHTCIDSFLQYSNSR